MVGTSVWGGGEVGIAEVCCVEGGGGGGAGWSGVRAVSVETLRECVCMLVLEIMVGEEIVRPRTPFRLDRPERSDAMEDARLLRLLGPLRGRGGDANGEDGPGPAECLDDRGVRSSFVGLRSLGAMCGLPTVLLLMLGQRACFRGDEACDCGSASSYRVLLAF